MSLSGLMVPWGLESMMLGKCGKQATGIAGAVSMKQRGNKLDMA